MDHLHDLYNKTIRNLLHSKGDKKMKKFGHILLLLIILSAYTSAAQKSVRALSVSTLSQESMEDRSVAGSNRVMQPAGYIDVPRFQPSTYSTGVHHMTAAISALQTGEALTPFQQQLQQTINERKEAGLPVPSSVKFEHQATSNEALGQIAGSATASATPGKVVSQTIIVFDSPEQAGYNEWPALVVKNNLPPDAQGSVLEGDYTDEYRKFMEEKVPGIWEKYEFGHEPRTQTIEETIEFTYPENRMLAPLSEASSTAASTDQLLMGFTYTGPHLDYSIGDKQEVCVIWCVTIYEFKAGFELDWALGLRLPGQADLTGPDQLMPGSPYSFSSAMTALDWSAENYSASGVAPENGNEFVLRLNFFLGVKGVLLGINLCSSCFVETNVDRSTSFATPFGPDTFFLIPEATIPVYDLDLGIASFGVGLVLAPKLGSDKITANWQASGDAYGSGSITYTNPGTPVSFGPVTACKRGPDNLAQIQLNDFRYWFNQFLIELGATLTFEIFNYGGKVGNFPITSFDLSPLTGDLSLGRHRQCEWDFTCSDSGPSNTINVGIPVGADLIPPNTSLLPTGTAGNNGWYTSDVQVSLSAADDCGSGVQQTEYSFDGSTWNIYTGPFTISSEGSTTISYRSTDNVNNAEETQTQSIKIDKTPPTIIATYGRKAPKTVEWHNTDVVVHFDASDALSGIDTVTPTQTLSSEGANQSVTGTAVDMAGLSSSVTVAGINIDKTSPNLSITSPVARTYNNRESFNVIWSTTDTLSGVASEKGDLDGGPIKNGQLIELLTVGPGPHTVAVKAIDEAHNTTSISVDFSVSVDIEGLLAALERMCELGWIDKDIDKHSVCKSLESKLSASIASINGCDLDAAQKQLHAFLKTLDAQKGKAINASAYRVLNADTLFVIEHLSD